MSTETLAEHSPKEQEDVIYFKADLEVMSDSDLEDARKEAYDRLGDDKEFIEGQGIEAMESAYQEITDKLTSPDIKAALKAIPEIGDDEFAQHQMRSVIKKSLANKIIREWFPVPDDDSKADEFATQRYNAERILMQSPEDFYDLIDNWQAVIDAEEVVEERAQKPENEPVVDSTIQDALQKVEGLDPNDHRIQEILDGLKAIMAMLEKPEAEEDKVKAESAWRKRWDKFKDAALHPGAWVASKIDAFSVMRQNAKEISSGEKGEKRAKERSKRGSKVLRLTGYAAVGLGLGYVAYRNGLAESASHYAKSAAQHASSLAQEFKNAGKSNGESGHIVSQSYTHHFSENARNVSPGEGWAQTVREVTGVKNNEQYRSIMQEVGPKLSHDHLAYKIDNNNYGILKKGKLPQKALQMIYDVAKNKGYVK